MSNSDLRMHATRLRRWCTSLCVFLLAVITIEIATRAGAFRENTRYHLLGLELLFAVPVLLQLAALWKVRGALASVGKGALFTLTLATTLRAVGVLLSLAAIITLVLAPLLHSLAREAFPRSVGFDVANLVLGTLGMMLILFARLFERAVDVQRELDDIF